MSKSQFNRPKAQVKLPVKKSVLGARRQPMRVPAKSVKKATAKQKQGGAPNSAAVGRFIASSLAGLIPGGAPFAGIAGKIGEWAGGKIGTTLGLGEYEVKRNTIISEGNTPPFMHSEEDFYVLRHREYLGDVFSAPVAGDFSVTNYAINPGLSSSFPWLSIEAVGFREWTPLGMMFEFKSNTGFVSNASSPAVGMVIMATDYNAFDTNPFANKLEMENNMYTTSAKSTESFYHPIECKPTKNVLDRYYLRAGAIPDNQPPQLYDLGTFAIASVGQPTANQNLGELWCTVEIGFSKATLQNRHDNESSTDMWAFVGATDTIPFSGTTVYQASNTLGGYLTGGTVYHFPPTRTDGDFLVLYYTGSIAAPTGMTSAPILSNCVVETEEWQATSAAPPTNPTLCPSQPAFGNGPANSAGFNFGIIVMKIRITGRNATFDFNFGPGPNWTANPFFLVTPVAHAVRFGSSAVMGAPRGKSLIIHHPENYSEQRDDDQAATERINQCRSLVDKTREMEEFYALYKAFKDQRHSEDTPTAL